MVLPGSNGVPRAPPYSGTNTPSHCLFEYVPITLYGGAFHPTSSKTMISYSNPGLTEPELLALQPPYNNASKLSRHTGLGSTPFVRHY